MTQTFNVTTLQIPEYNIVFHREGLDMISSTQDNASGVNIVFWDLGLNNKTKVKKVKIIFWDLELNHEEDIKRVKKIFLD